MDWHTCCQQRLEEAVQHAPPRSNCSGRRRTPMRPSLVSAALLTGTLVFGLVTLSSAQKVVVLNR